MIILPYLIICHRGLPSVDCNIKTTGRKATTNLIRMINGEKDIKDCVVDYNIVEGETL